MFDFVIPPTLNLNLTLSFDSASLKALETIMSKLDDLQAAVAAEKTAVDSAVTLIKGLADQIANLEPTQAAIDALAADVRSQTQSLSDAVAAVPASS